MGVRGDQGAWGREAGFCRREGFGFIERVVRVGEVAMGEYKFQEHGFTGNGKPQQHQTYARLHSNMTQMMDAWLSEAVWSR